MIDEDTRARILASIPDVPGVYRFVDGEGAALYVGKSVGMRKRVASHFREGGGSPRMRRMVALAEDVTVVPTRNEAEALLLENNLIKELRPRFNILFRDDKSYPYLRLTAHPYPRLMSYRGRTDDGSEYFGPFPNSRSVRESIDLIQKVFRLRTCRDAFFANRSRPCLLHQIGRCSAPCVNRVAPEAYAADVGRVRGFLAGRTDEIAHELGERMEEASGRQEYERAAAIRDNIAALRDVRKRHHVDDLGEPDADYVGVAVADGRACVVVSMVRGGRGLGDMVRHPENYTGEEEAEVLRAFVAQHYSRVPPPALVVCRAATDADGLRRACGRGDARFVTRPVAVARERVAQASRNAETAIRMRGLREDSREEALAALCARLGLPGGAGQVDCFDVSHSFGEETVASCVVCRDGEMAPSLYRRFRIRGAGGGDDYAALAEALSRRYRRVAKEGGDAPDLVVVDGGAGQVSAAAAALGEAGMGAVPLVGIAKGRARRPGDETVLLPTGEVVEWPPSDPGFRLVQRIRDEAHRFAIGGHRLRRDRKRHRSVMEDIEGIGPRRRRQLIAQFGGLRGLKEASREELARIKGVGPELAERIYRALH